ncbi:hypothetical protein SSP35_11_00160 [Streptomyces sp. NBRC 110611]|nr:hypothetical protein SSP35_11_00160 [Streptomyces sp. NBRC 110611]
MRTLISTAFISLDGVVEAPGGEPGYRNSGWTFKDIEFLPEAFDIKGREQKEATAILMGRTSYEAFSPVWPDMEDFADYKVMPKYVVSTHPHRGRSGVELGRDDDPALARRRRRAQGDRGRPDHRPRQRLPEPGPFGRRPHRPLSPARLPASARGTSSTSSTDAYGPRYCPIPGTGLAAVSW